MLEPDVRDELTRLGRFPERARYDFESIAAILDEAIICHVGFTVDDQPIVMPTIYARRGRQLYLHGSALTRWLTRLSGTVPLCLTVTILDALVLARSAFNHSLNYRSVVVLGEAEPVVDPSERLAAMKALVEHVCPGRWNDVRRPTDAELGATLVLRIEIKSASAKVRFGPPDDPAKDRGKGIWGGVVPVQLSRGNPIADPTLEPGVALPDYLRFTPA